MAAVVGRSTGSLEGIGINVANQPRYRDGAIVMFIAGILGIILGLDTGARAIDGLPGSWGTAAWSITLLVASVLVIYIGSRILKRADRGK
jgi:hypothetical protein